MKLHARQGDLVFNKLPAELQSLPRLPEATECKVEHGALLAGSDSDPHTVAGEALVWRSGRSTFLRLSADTEVRHAGRHLPVLLVAGDYEVYPLRERGDQEDRAVDD